MGVAPRHRAATAGGNAMTRPATNPLRCLAMLAVVSVLAVPASAETSAAIPRASYVIRNWNTADGLPDNTVRAIVPSRDGYLWVGTAGGIARFDGIRFKVFTSGNTPALVSDNISGAAEDREGRIWFGTTHGTAVWENGAFRWASDRDGAPPLMVGDVEVDGLGTVWISTVNGLYRREGAGFARATAPGEMRTMAVSPRGDLWISGLSGLARWNGHAFERAEGSPGADSMAFDARGGAWVLRFPRTIERWDGTRTERVPDVTDGWLQALQSVPGGDVWAGARTGSEVFRFRAGGVQRLDAMDGLHGVRPIRFRADAAGNLWVGVNRGGLYRLREPQLELFQTGVALPPGAMMSVAEDDAGRVHVAAMGAGLLRFERGTFRPLLVGDPNSPLFLATALQPAPGGGMWVGSQVGELRRWDGARVGPPEGGGGGTRALMVDSAGRVWRGTLNSGLVCDDGTARREYRVSNGWLGNDSVTALAEDREHVVWVGTERGLNRILPGGTEHYGMAQGLAHEWVRSLCVDSSGRLWVGTPGGGLATRVGSRFVAIGRADGLPSGRIESLVEDGSRNLWIGTPTGLVRVALDELVAFAEGRARAVHCTVYGVEDGLPLPGFGSGFQPAALRDREGHLWFCGDSGVVRVDPARLAVPVPAPRVRIEEVRVDGTPLTEAPSRGPVRVPASCRRLEINYTGLDLVAPDRVRFRYRMGGLETDWVEAGEERVARYARPRPGTYRFEVHAANNEGAWSAEAPSLDVVVAPYLWQTDWFRASVVALALAAAVAAYRVRIARLERRRAAQEGFSRQLIESQERERARIADELHDGLGHGLLVLKNRADFAAARESSPARLAAHLREVSALATAAIHEVRGVARNLRPFQLDELGLTKAIGAIVRNLADASDIEFQVSLDPSDDALAPDDRINFYRIVQECLNNVVKHSRARNATVGLRWTGRLLRLTIADDGVGFATDAEPPAGGTGFGLGNIEQRARSLGGTATFESAPGEGTRVTVEVPAVAPRPDALPASHTQTFRKPSA